MSYGNTLLHIAGGVGNAIMRVIVATFIFKIETMLLIQQIKDHHQSWVVTLM